MTTSVSLLPCLLAYRLTNQMPTPDMLLGPFCSRTGQARKWMLKRLSGRPLTIPPQLRRRSLWFCHSLVTFISPRIPRPPDRGGSSLRQALASYRPENILMAELNWAIEEESAFGEFPPVL